MRASICSAALALAALGAAPAFADSDIRNVVVLPADDREHLLADMREWLERSTGIVEALAADDAARVRTLAAGMRPPLARARLLAEGPGAAPVPGPSAPAGPRSPRDAGRFKRMQHNLPAAFRSMMFEVRREMAELEGSAGGDPRVTLTHLARLQNVCIACHRAYRLLPGEPGASEP